MSLSDVKTFFLEIVHIGYPKIKNFTLISNMFIYLTDKMLLKKYHIKKRKIGI